MEEGYHIWGTSWMMQFGYLPTGGYFWRPPWINHGAFQSDYGCLAIGRTDSQLHNYFHFNPWTTPEENQERAAAQLHRHKPNLYNWIQARTVTTTRTTSSIRITTNTTTITTDSS